MPEFPEVYTITSDLKNNIVGFKIIKATSIPKYNVDESVGRTIVDVKQIAKNIVIELDLDKFLVFHLAMTGRILLRNNIKTNDEWVQMVLEIKKRNKKYFLKFTDMRGFGKVQVLNRKGFKKLTQKYGPNPLNEISPKEFLDIIKSKNTNIKNLLLNQEIISGVGNIYATDALFLSGVNPKTTTKNIDLKTAETILKNLRVVLKEGIKNRGSTLPDKMYIDIFGKPGFQQKHFKIYMKKRCPNCNSEIKYFKLNGRGTYYCPKCQPLPRNTIDKSTPNKVDLFSSY